MYTHNEVVTAFDLPPKTSKIRLKQFFDFAGKIASIRIDPVTRNARITFGDTVSAHNLLQYQFENGLICFDGFYVKLKPEFDDDVWNNKDYTDEKVVIWRIPCSVSKTKLRKLFSFAGRMKAIEIFPQDFHAVITFFSVASADAVRASKMQFHIDGFLLGIHNGEQESSDESSDESIVDSSEESCDDFDETRLYIGNIPTDVDEDELRQMFSGFGRIIGLNIVRRGNRGCFYGFITFQNARSAHNLLKRSFVKTFTIECNDLKIERVK